MFIYEFNFNKVNYVNEFKYIAKIIVLNIYLNIKILSITALLLHRVIHYLNIIPELNEYIQL